MIRQFTLSNIRSIFTSLLLLCIVPLSAQFTLQQQLVITDVPQGWEYDTILVQVDTIMVAPFTHSYFIAPGRPIGSSENLTYSQFSFIPAPLDSLRYRFNQCGDTSRPLIHNSYLAFSLPDSGYYEFSDTISFCDIPAIAPLHLSVFGQINNFGDIEAVNNDVFVELFEKDSAGTILLIDSSLVTQNTAHVFASSNFKVNHEYTVKATPLPSLPYIFQYSYPVYLGGEENIQDARWIPISGSISHFVDTIYLPNTDSTVPRYDRMNLSLRITDLPQSYRFDSLFVEVDTTTGANFSSSFILAVGRAPLSDQDLFGTAEIPIDSVGIQGTIRYRFNRCGDSAQSEIFTITPKNFSTESNLYEYEDTLSFCDELLFSDIRITVTGQTNSSGQIASVGSHTKIELYERDSLGTIAMVDSQAGTGLSILAGSLFKSGRDYTVRAIPLSSGNTYLYEHSIPTYLRNSAAIQDAHWISSTALSQGAVSDSLHLINTDTLDRSFELSLRFNNVPVGLQHDSLFLMVDTVMGPFFQSSFIMGVGRPVSSSQNYLTGQLIVEDIDYLPTGDIRYMYFYCGDSSQIVTNTITPDSISPDSNVVRYADEVDYCDPLPFIGKNALHLSLKLTDVPQTYLNDSIRIELDTFFAPNFMHSLNIFALRSDVEPNVFELDTMVHLHGGGINDNGDIRYRYYLCADSASPFEYHATPKSIVVDSNFYVYSDTNIFCSQTMLSDLSFYVYGELDPSGQIGDVSAHTFVLLFEKDSLNNISLIDSSLSPVNNPHIFSGENMSTDKEYTVQALPLPSLPHLMQYSLPTYLGSELDIADARWIRLNDTIQTTVLDTVFMLTTPAPEHYIHYNLRFTGAPQGGPDSISVEIDSIGGPTFTAYTFFLASRNIGSGDDLVAQFTLSDSSFGNLTTIRYRFFPCQDFSQDTIISLMYSHKSNDTTFYVDSTAFCPQTNTLADIEISVIGEIDSSGQIGFVNSDTYVILFSRDSANTISIVDTSFTSGGNSHLFQSNTLDTSLQYTALAVPQNTNNYLFNNSLPTYLGNETEWENAHWFSAVVSGGLTSISDSIFLAVAPSGSGNGIITGNISAGSGRDTGSVGSPDLLIILSDTLHNVIHFTYTDANGDFVIDRVDNGYYDVHAEKLGKISDRARIVLSSNNPAVLGVNFEENENGFRYLGTISVNKHELGLLNLFPNPTSGTFILSIPKEQGKISVELIDMSGRVCMRRTENNVNQVSFDISDYKSGLYLIRITDSYGNVQTKKLIKN